MRALGRCQFAEVELRIATRQVEEVTLGKCLILERGEEGHFTLCSECADILLVDEVECFVTGNGNLAPRGGRRHGLLRRECGARAHTSLEQAIHIDVLLDERCHIFGECIQLLQLAE